jgi:predicted ABC-type ATPase
MVGRINDLAARGADFAFETTLSGRGAQRQLTDLVARGYAVHIFYLWLPTADMAIARVRQRVASGGHAVPEPVITRRYWRSLRNFYEVYRPIATTWRVYDSSGLRDPSLIASGDKTGKVLIAKANVWKRILAQLAASGRASPRP